MSTWKRRAVSIPAVLGAAFAAVALSPLAIVAAAIYDLVRGKRRLPSVRIYLFCLQYLVNDGLEIVAAPWYWVVAGFGTRLTSARSIARHERLQAWSISVLARRAESLLGLVIECDSSVEATLIPGRAILICRHVSAFDASLPSLLCQRVGLRSRGVIMAEMLADPGFDLLYARTGSVFIARDNGPEALARVASLGRDLDRYTAAIIFPEGRLFRPELRDRLLERLATTNPDRHKRLAGLRHVLPPRPGGLSAMLEAAPDADVVVIAHEGLDGVASIRALAAAIPLETRWTVTAWRAPRSEIPTDVDGQAKWLDEQWCRIDAWIDQRRTATTTLGR